MPAWWEWVSGILSYLGHQALWSAFGTPSRWWNSARKRSPSMYVRPYRITDKKVRVVGFVSDRRITFLAGAADVN